MKTILFIIILFMVGCRAYKSDCDATILNLYPQSNIVSVDSYVYDPDPNIQSNYTYIVDGDLFVCKLNLLSIELKRATTTTLNKTKIIDTDTE